ncbi:MAG: acetylxylan esterase [Chthoniobacterales bacterium]
MNLSDIENLNLGYHNFGTNLKDYIYDRSRVLFSKGDAARDAIQTSQDVQQRQAAIRSFIIESLGGLPSMETPLNARTVGTVQGEGFSIEKVIFESRPGNYVTTILYLPTKRPEKCGAVLFLCGHHAEGKHVEEYQRVCQTFALAGLIVLAQDPVGQGERSSYYDPALGKQTIPYGVPDHNYQGVQCELVGDTIARYFLHDAMRSIDYLISRPEVDPLRIGVTGNSGGGTQTSLVMMGDPRIAAAAPATFIMSRDSYQRTGQAQDEEQIWPGFTAAGYDHEDILLAVAPKPVCVLAVTYDFFPIEGTRRTVNRSKRIWDIFQKSDTLEIVEDTCTHAYSPVLAKAAASFFSRHLLEREVDSSKLNPNPVPPKQLWCTKSGHVRADFPNARVVFDENLDRVKEAKIFRDGLSSAPLKTKALEWLRGKVFAHREPCALNPRFPAIMNVEDFEIQAPFWWSQPNLANSAIIIRPIALEGKKLPVTIAVWPGGSRNLAQNAKWIRKHCEAGRAVFVLNLCGMGPHHPHTINFHDHFNFYGTFQKFADDLIWMNDSLPALRIYEVLRAVELVTELSDLDSANIEVFAQDRYGVYTQLAAALEPRIKRHEWQNVFTYKEISENRHYDSFDIKSLLLPGVLRHFDLDEL